MCNLPEEDVSDEDRSEAYVKGITSEKHRVTYYKDGSSTHHWGGPCGPTNYDEFGEEC